MKLEMNKKAMVRLGQVWTYQDDILGIRRDFVVDSEEQDGSVIVRDSGTGYHVSVSLDAFKSCAFKLIVQPATIQSWGE